MPSRVKMIGVLSGDYYAGKALKQQIKKYMEGSGIKLEPKGWKGWVEAFEMLPIKAKAFIVLREPRGVDRSKSRYRYIVDRYGVRTMSPRAPRPSSLRMRLGVTPPPPQPRVLAPWDRPWNLPTMSEVLGGRNNELTNSRSTGNVPSQTVGEGQFVPNTPRREGNDRNPSGF